ncbi:sensor histidine kinase [Bacillus xiapuensis]|uniref:Sensor histidine kinase n=1 Tax=Bacillus xiapuensis TaxID=2014075 RepID=A0ABU6N9G7_9BACI|nr:sensor histidine kinase [Bacillus xiapuensis]
MSTAGRQIVWSVGFSFLTAIIVSVVFINVFPLSSWSELWDRHFMDIPIGIFIPVFSIALGVIIGAISGFLWRRQLLSVDYSLHQLEEGRPAEVKIKPSITEVQTIANRIEKIGKQMSEQAKLSQRLATEKVEDQESRIQEIIEQERNRLARELHDSVSQQLFAASMMMSAINETKNFSEDDREGKQLKMVEEMIHQSQLEMRALLLHLRPIALKNKTLQEGIEELLVELSMKVSMDIKWKVESFSLDKGVEDHLFRILQESVSNTLRHAKAGKLEVLLIKRDDLVIMRVVDDGVGFEVNDETKAGSYGMQNMHERAVEVGGTLKVVSMKNKGTRLEVKVPVVKNGDGGSD